MINIVNKCAETNHSIHPFDAKQVAPLLSRIIEVCPIKIKLHWYRHVKQDVSLFHDLSGLYPNNFTELYEKSYSTIGPKVTLSIQASGTKDILAMEAAFFAVLVFFKHRLSFDALSDVLSISKEEAVELVNRFTEALFENRSLLDSQTTDHINNFAQGHQYREYGEDGQVTLAELYNNTSTVLFRGCMEDKDPTQSQTSVCLLHVDTDIHETGDAPYMRTP